MDLDTRIPFELPSNFRPFGLEGHFIQPETPVFGYGFLEVMRIWPVIKNNSLM